MAETGTIPQKIRWAIYATGLFSNSANAMVAVAVPLWLISLNASPAVIGFAMGARYILPTLLSIHAGLLMDKLGTRRVLLVFALIGVVTPPLHPVLPWVWAVVILQMLGGLSSSMGWVGGQTLIGQLTGGSHTESGRLAASHRVGSLIAGPLAGATWDLFGPWGAFSLMGIWGCGLLVASLVLPKTLPSQSRFRGPVGWRDVTPNYADYRKTFALLATPAVGLIVFISMLNLTGGAIQFSFFVVYLDSLEMPGTLIGIIMSSYSVMAAVGALTTGFLARHFTSHWLLYVMVIVSVVGLMCTPLLTTFVTIIVMTMARGFAQGIGQPLMISTASRVTEPGEQGRSVGLRVTANRLTLTVTPIVMGAVIELVGLNASFWVMGGALLVALAGAAVAMVLTRAFDEPS